MEAEPLVLSSQRPLVLCHVEPDGDAIGSGLGLALGLQQLGKPALLACADPLPAHFRFLPRIEQSYRQSVPPEPPDLLIGVDTSNPERFGPLFEQNRDLFTATPILNVDHHVTNTLFGTVNLVDPAAAAVAEVVYALLLALGVRMDVPVATCLLTAILADTQCFRTDSTRPTTLRIAADLQAAGAPLAELMRHNAVPPLGKSKLFGQLLSVAQTEGRLSWVALDLEKASRLDGAAELWNGLAELLFRLEGATVVAILREVAGGVVKVSLRSAGDLNVAETALAFGGGGHPRAAGFTVPGRLNEAEQAVLSYLRRQLTSRAE